MNNWLDKNDMEIKPGKSGVCEHLKQDNISPNLTKNPFALAKGGQVACFFHPGPEEAIEVYLVFP